MAHQISLPYSTSKLPHWKKGRKKREKGKKEEKPFSHIFLKLFTCL
jgi:hypothetical protein